MSNATRHEQQESRRVQEDAARAPDIADYGLIGDGRCAALVARDGGLDWLCLPHFSSPAVFARILDPVRGGTCVIRPRADYKVRRRYRPGTAILETIFETAAGTARLTDFFPIEEGVDTLLPMRELIRVVDGVDGTVPITFLIDPQFDFGRLARKPQCRSEMGWAYAWSNNLLAVRADCHLDSSGTALHGALDIRAGQRVAVSLAFSQGDIGIWPVLGDEVSARLERTAAWWIDWIAQSAYRGRYRELVERSAITLKLLTYCLSGAVTAAASASLPENVGGSRNWDYRFCWLRDAGMTVQAMVGLGYMNEARRFLDWLLHATRLTWPRLQVVYDVYGHTTLTEHVLEHLSGHKQSRPVRIGNAASNQYQLDVYGEVIVAAEAFVAGGGVLEPADLRMLRGFAKVVSNEWHCPDNGIWEIRGSRRQYTFSKMMCWLALDRLLKLEGRGSAQLGSFGERIRAVRDEIAAMVKRHAYDETLNSYVGIFDGRMIDASLLLMGCHGYPAAEDPCLVGTQDRIWKTLGRGPLLYRYTRDLDEEPEGAFLILSFWATQNLAMRGDIDAAHRLFDQVSTYANDLGLLSEQADPDSGDALGNFPQAFSHIGLINAALAIEKAEKVASRC